MKTKIVGSTYADTDLDGKLCTHLQPIWDFIKKKAPNNIDSGDFEKDPKGGTTLNVRGKIDFDEIERTFEYPSFVVLKREYRSIFCKTCWCDIKASES